MITAVCGGADRIVSKLFSKCNGFSDSPSRREFFHRATAMLAGAAVTRDYSFDEMLPAGRIDLNGDPDGLPPQPPLTPRGELRVNNLPASRLGKTDIDVTKIGFGGLLTDQPNVLLHAIDQGLNFVHTSPGYQNGKSIAAFGKVLKEHRSRVVVAVKERPEMLDSVLPVLNTDYVDIVMPSIQSPAALNDPRLLEDFERAKQAGKCRYLGFACHSQMTRVLEKAVEKDIFDVALISYMNTDDPWFFRSLRLAKKAGMGIVAMKGLPASGYRANHEDMFELTNTRCNYILNRWYADSIMASMSSYQTVEAFGRIMDSRLLG